MAIEEQLPPNVVAPSKADPIEVDGWTHGLKSKWPIALDLAGSNLPCRLEGEVGSLVRKPKPPPESLA